MQWSEVFLKNDCYYNCKHITKKKQKTSLITATWHTEIRLSLMWFLAGCFYGLKLGFGGKYLRSLNPANNGKMVQKCDMGILHCLKIFPAFKLVSRNFGSRRLPLYSFYWSLMFRNGKADTTVYLCDKIISSAHRLITYGILHWTALTACFLVRLDKQLLGDVEYFSVKDCSVL